jgi:hypothetical protein
VAQNAFTGIKTALPKKKFVLHGVTPVENRDLHQADRGVPYRKTSLVFVA